MTESESGGFLERPEESGAAASEFRLGRTLERGRFLCWLRPAGHFSYEQLQYYRSSAPLDGMLKYRVKA